LLWETLAEDIERTVLIPIHQDALEAAAFPRSPTEFLAPEKFLERAKEAVLVTIRRSIIPFA